MKKKIVKRERIIGDKRIRNNIKGGDLSIPRTHTNVQKKRITQKHKKNTWRIDKK